MRRFGVLAAALAAGGCATQGDPAALGAAGDLPRLAVTVAAQLEEAAASDPGRLSALELELRRISDALPLSRAAIAAGAALPQTYALAPADGSRESAANGAAGGGMGTAALEAQPADAEGGGDAYAPPPDLAGARSLFSALTLGAYPSADTARAAWFGMNAAHGEALAGLDARIEAVERNDGAAAYVLKAGPFGSATEAETLCTRLRSAGAVCTAGDFTGEAL